MVAAELNNAITGDKKRAVKKKCPPTGFSFGKLEKRASQKARAIKKPNVATSNMIVKRPLRFIAYHPIGLGPAFFD